MKRCMLLALLAGCPMDATEIGPNIHVEISSRLNSTSDMDPDPHITLSSTATQYMLDFKITAEAGVERKSADETLPKTFVPTHFSLTIEPIAIALTETDFTPHIVLDDRRYDGGPSVDIPAAMKGTSLTVHLEGEDSRGLHSNIVDFVLALR
jgi:hypothetical protein